MWGLTGEEDVSSGTGEFVLLVVFADVGDGLQGQVEDENLDEAGEGSCDDLGHEHGAWRDLHVVAEFEI